MPPHESRADPSQQPTAGYLNGLGGPADHGDEPVGLHELVSLLLTTRGVEDFLTELAGLAAAALASSCGITSRRGDQPITVASSDSLADSVDEVQYDVGQGPCLQAMATGKVVHVPDVTDERRWGSYPARALANGVASSLSLPLSSDGYSVGALNLYARTTHAFDDPADVARAAAFASQGSAVLTVAVHQAQQTVLTEQLSAALSSRSVIDQALGILMAQQRCNAATAFTYLRTASQTRNRKLRDIATDIVTAVGGPSPEPAPSTRS